MIELKLVDNIIFAHFPTDLKLDLNGVKQIVEDRKKLQNGGCNPLLVHFDSIISNSRDMRKFMSVEGISGISCIAFVVKNKRSEIFLKMFVIAGKIGIPSTIFSDEQEAITWLKAKHQPL